MMWVFLLSMAVLFCWCTLAIEAAYLGATTAPLVSGSTSKRADASCIMRSFSFTLRMDPTSTKDVEDQDSGSCRMITAVKTADCAAPSKTRRACNVNHRDHDAQLAMQRAEPIIQCWWTLFFDMWIDEFHKLLIACPRYKVSVMTPANEITVPSTLANPRVSLMLSTSCLRIDSISP
ncbi:hypothetical protein AKJ16_DCAP19228 [Drosera capensis]